MQTCCNGLHAWRSPIALDVQRFGIMIDCRISYPANPKHAPQLVSCGERELTRILKVANSLAKIN